MPDAFRAATAERRKLHVRYVCLEEGTLEGTVRPLGCFAWRGVPALGIWSEGERGFRSLRMDRIVEWRLLDDRFEHEPGRTMDDLLRLLEAEMAARDSDIDA